MPPPEVIERAFILAGKGAERAMQDILSVNLTPEFMTNRPEVVAHLVSYGLENRMKRDGFAGQMSAVSDHDTAARLEAIKVPTFIIAGDKDELTVLGFSFKPSFANDSLIHIIAPVTRTPV